MKNLFIILFLFFVLLSAIDIKIDIQKIEYINNKIRYKIKLKIYIFKLLIFSKNIHKKTILNLLEKIPENSKEEKRLEKQIENLEIKIEYGLKEPIKNAYIFSILNTISAVSIQSINAKRRKIELKTNYNKNYLYIKIKALIKIKHIKTFINLIKSKKLIYKT